MSWAELVRTIWPIAATITPFVLAAGFAWLKLQFPTKADLEKLRGSVQKDVEEMRMHTMSISDRQIASDARVDAVEKDLERAPSKLDLSKDIGKVAERVGHLESGVGALTRQLTTSNQYLHTLLEKHIK